MDAIQAAQENGRTIPVVPNIDNPLTIPNLGFHVFLAIISPFGIDKVISILGFLS